MELWEYSSIMSRWLGGTPAANRFDSIGPVEWRKMKTILKYEPTGMCFQGNVSLKVQVY